MEGRFMAVQQAIRPARVYQAGAAFPQEFVGEAKASRLAADFIQRHKLAGLRGRWDYTPGVDV